MRVYLEEFFKEFSYEAADAAYLLEVYDRIDANDAARALWDKALAHYDENSEYTDNKTTLDLADQVAELLDIHAFTTELLIFICMSRRLKVRYQERGIDLSIFHNSMLDLRYKLDECKAVRGIIGSFVADWFTGFFRMTLFALGRLQFEVIKFNHTLELDGKQLTPETKVITIHIPRTGTPMSPEACDASFAMAKEFFAGQYSEPCAFQCGSWLLFPKHREFLSEHSNTRKFMDRFTIYNSGIYKDGNALWRLFDTDEKNPDRLPADSTMRRQYIAHMKQGGKTGWGEGIFFL